MLSSEINIYNLVFIDSQQDSGQAPLASQQLRLLICRHRMRSNSGVDYMDGPNTLFGHVKD